VDYEFFFKYDGTPLFKPIATVGASQFTFGKELISSFNYIENIDEVRNHIVIEGEEYSIYDELYRILDGTEIMYTLDDIDDGDPVTGYGRMKMTSIAAGKIIIAGCDAEVTDQMFTDPQAKDNIEAWQHAADATVIDGGKIRTGTIVADSIAADAIETDKIKAEAVDAGKIKTGTITTLQIAAQAVEAGDIKSGTITALQIAGNTITTGEINFVPFEIGTHDADNVPPSATKKWAGETGADITLDHVAASFLNQGDLAILNTIDATHIDANAVTTPKINAQAVDAGKIKTGTITTLQIAAQAVEAGDIKSGTITALQIAGNTITTGEINFVPFEIGTHDADNVPPSATKKWAGETGADITLDHVAASFLNQGDLAILNTIDATHIDANAVTTPKINAQAVDAGKIKTGTITTLQIAAQAVEAGDIKSGTITALQIAADAITTDKIKADAVTANKIDVDNLSAISANVGTLTAGTIRSTTLYIGRDATHEVSPDWIQAGVNRAMNYIGDNGYYYGAIVDGQTGFCYGAVHPVHAYLVSGSIYHLGFDVTDSGGGGGTGSNPPHSNPEP